MGEGSPREKRALAVVASADIDELHAARISPWEVCAGRNGYRNVSIRIYYVIPLQSRSKHFCIHASTIPESFPRWRFGWWGDSSSANRATARLKFTSSPAQAIHVCGIHTYNILELPKKICVARCRQSKHELVIKIFRDRNLIAETFSSASFQD